MVEEEYYIVKIMDLLAQPKVNIKKNKTIEEKIKIIFIKNLLEIIYLILKSIRLEISFSHKVEELQWSMSKKMLIALN